MAKVGITCGGVWWPTEHFQAAEELGFDSIWTGEHIVFHRPILDAVPVLAGIAAVTERILLGPAAILTPLRHPTMLAKELATLDIIAGGTARRRRGRGRRLPQGVRGRGSADGQAGAPNDRDHRDHAQVLDRGDVLLSGLGVRAGGRLADAEAGSGRRTADLARRALRRRDHARSPSRRRLHALHVHGRALPGGLPGGS